MKFAGFAITLYCVVASIGYSSPQYAPIIPDSSTDAPDAPTDWYKGFLDFTRTPPLAACRPDDGSNLEKCSEIAIMKRNAERPLKLWALQKLCVKFIEEDNFEGYSEYGCNSETFSEFHDLFLNTINACIKKNNIIDDIECEFYPLENHPWSFTFWKKEVRVINLRAKLSGNEEEVIRAPDDLISICQERKVRFKEKVGSDKMKAISLMKARWCHLPVQQATYKFGKFCLERPNHHDCNLY